MTEASPVPRKTQFYWASIHGADPEPVEICTVEGRRACYTLGCGDPFYLDEDPCPVLFVDQEAMLRPEHPDKKEAERAAKYAGRRSYLWKGKRIHLPPVSHGWRGPR
jgi:hypothetical protein